MLKRTIAPSVLFVLFFLLASPLASDPHASSSGSNPPYASSFSVSLLSMLTDSSFSPPLLQGCFLSGVSSRSALPLGLRAQSSFGLSYAAPSVYSSSGVAYRPFLGAWVEGGLGWRIPDSALALDVSASLHSGYAPGSAIAEMLSGYSISLSIEGSSPPRPATSKATGYAAEPYFSPELSIPLGLLQRNGSLSFFTGVSFRLWRVPYRTGTAE